MPEWWILVSVFLGLMVGLFVYATRIRQRPDTYQEIVVRITADISAFQTAIRLRLSPALEAAARAMREFDEEYRKAAAVMEGSSDSIAEWTRGEVDSE